MPSIVDLITERETAVAVAIATLREQIGNLTDELHAAETELSDLATTRTTLVRLTSIDESVLSGGGPIDNTVYQQIITAFQIGDHPTMRARDVCHALGLGAEPKDTEGVRAKLKRLVKRQILTEPQPGVFTLAVPAKLTEPAATTSPNSTPNVKPA